MNGFDIIVGIPLLYAAYKGFRAGVLVQLGGIVGLLIGVWLAFRYGPVVGGWLHLDAPTDAVVGFIAILLAALLAISLVGHLARSVFRIAGLGPFDAIGGLVLGIVKMALVLSVLLSVFEAMNERAGWVERDRYAGAALYGPVRGTTDLLFPYL